MAVVQPFDPNLTGAYNNIQEALSQRANIQAKLTGGAGTVAAAVSPVADVSKDRAATMFRATLEDQLSKNKSNYAAISEGRALYTQDDLETDMQREHPKMDAKYYKGLVPKQGVFISPEEKMKIGNLAARNAAIESAVSFLEQKGDPVSLMKARLLNIAGRDPQADASIIPRALDLGKPIMKKSPTDGLFHIYDDFSKQDLGVVPGAYTSDSDSGVPLLNDVPSLRVRDKLQADRLQQIGDTSAKDPVLNQQAHTLEELKQVEKLVKANVPGSQINIGADAAKSIGGIPGGRFSSLVALKEGKDPSLMGRLGQGYVTLTSGNYSENNQQLLLKELGIARDQKTQDLSAALDDKVNAAKLDVPLASEKLIRGKIAGNYSRYLTPEEGKTTLSPSVNVHDPKTLAAVKLLQDNGQSISSKNVAYVLANPNKFDISSYLKK